MNKNLKAILKGVRYVSDHSDEDVYLDYNSPCFVSSSDSRRTFNHSEYTHELDANIDWLVQQGYIIRKGSRTVALTFKGLHPYAVMWNDFKQFLKFSILTPIIVSIITAILTVLVLEALGLSSPR